MADWYTYSYKLNALEVFFKSMRDLGVTIATFDHEYNKVRSHVIFDTMAEEWKMIFIKHLDGAMFEFPVARGYKIEIRSFEKYQEFRKYFGIYGKSGEFKFSDFMPHLNRQVPDSYILDDNKRETIISYNRIDSKSSGIYPIGTINWMVVHMKNPSLDNDKYHRTAENLKETRELYPEIYEAIKDMDVSIKYGEDSNEKTESIKNCSYNWDSVDE